LTKGAPDGTVDDQFNIDHGVRRSKGLPKRAIDKFLRNAKAHSQ
jgi:hypothetical protein